jgi:hypothetical protein
MEEYELYGYAVEVLNVFIGPDTGKYLGEEWWRYNKKIYKDEKTAREAVENNPYFKNGWKGFMEDYRIVPLYKKLKL